MWPSYPQPSSVLLPSLPPMPPPPLQLLSSASSDYLSSSTTLHQHTQTHSTRLVAVTTDTKRKMPLPATTLIKIETDATLDQTKTLQAVSTMASNTGTVFTDQNMGPLVTTHVIYQHPTNLILSQTPTGEAACRSQATSPVACLTPPPESQIHEEEPSSVQDASNQTDTPFCSEDDNTTHTIPELPVEARSKLEYIPEKVVVETPQECSDAKTPVPEMMEVVEEPSKPEEAETEVQSTTLPMEEEPEPEISSSVDETASPQKPDLSGLELLSNSIVEFENCRNKNEEEMEISHEISTSEVRVDAPPPLVQDTEIRSELIPNPAVDDSLGGLGLLCALAEQRIMEENERPKEKDRKERKKEKRKSKKHSSDEPKRKRMKHHEDREHKKREREKHYEKTEPEKEKSRCSCHEESYRTYKTPESEEEVKKFIASKSQPICCKGDWPCMNAMELDMRMKLAELQRQYREKQRELSKLKPKRHSTDSKKRSRKKSTHSLHSDRSSTPPPLLDKMDVPVKPNRDKPELLKPPTLCAMPKIDDIYKVSSDADSSPEKYSSSKKRKVGRPKKLMSSSGEHVATETIVAKKPKSSFVGYLLAAKEKFKQQNKAYPDATPPRYLEDTITIKHKKNKNNNDIIAIDVKSSKIRPKLRAEATVKTYADDDHNEWETITEEDEEEQLEREEEEDEAVQEVPSVTPPQGNGETEEEEAVEEEIVEEVKPEDTRCTLTAELLEVDKLRVLTAMGGLFYAGQLNALEPPDVYSITLDGERGNRPHIMSREEILRDAVRKKNLFLFQTFSQDLEP